MAEWAKKAAAEIDVVFILLNIHGFGVWNLTLVKKCPLVCTHLRRVSHYRRYLFQNRCDNIRVKGLCSLQILLLC